MQLGYIGSVFGEDRDERHAHWFLNALIIVQALSALYLLGDFIVDVIEADHSVLHTSAEGVAVICLIIGTYMSVRERQRLVARNLKIEGQLQMASGAFRELLEDYFDQWQLTPSEREIALFTIKGFSNAEIAEMRNTREGTVKAQSNAIFRKAGVSGRAQLLSHFIEELIGDPIIAPTDEGGQTTNKLEFLSQQAFRDRAAKAS